MDLKERIVTLEMTIAVIEYQLSYQDFPHRGADWERRARYSLGLHKAQLEAALASMAQLNLLLEMEG